MTFSVASPKELVPSVAGIADLVARLGSQHQSTPQERRSECRHVVATPAKAILLDDFLEPQGEPVSVVVRDVSPQGLGLVSNQPIDAGYLAVHEVGDQADPLTVRVLRSRRMANCYDIGCQICSPADQFRVLRATWHDNNARLEKAMEAILSKLD